MKKGINMDEQIALGIHRNWFKPKNYQIFAKEEMSLLTHEKLIEKVNKLSKGRYPQTDFTLTIKLCAIVQVFDHKY